MARVGAGETLAVSVFRAREGISVASYRRHPLHETAVDWPEKNCYADLFIAFEHTLGLEPRASLGYCAAVDFEGDNFTFFKPPHEELREFYGIDIQELNVWRPLLAHVEEHLAAGKFVATEADAYWLPDTSGTDYRRNHVKTTILAAEVDAGARTLGYFHNAGYYELRGEDFDGVMRTGAPDPARLPLYAELVKVDRLVRRDTADLGAMARARLAVHVARMPERNPVSRFADRFLADLPELQREGMSQYHAFAFATIRQLGAAAELLAAHLEWLIAVGAGAGLAPAAPEFRRLSADAKALVLKGARAAGTGKALDRALLDSMADAWARGRAALVSVLPTPQPTHSLA